MSSEAPECLIVAGPNGGGKSTVFQALLEHGELPADLQYINTDENFRTLRSSDERASEIAAARVSIEQLDAAIVVRRNFAFETTLSSRHSIRTISKARAAGYRVGLLYVILQKVELHNARIRTRVALGGHFVSQVDVARRYRTSLKNLADNLEIFDEGCVIDNSGAGALRRIIGISAGHISRLADFDENLTFDRELWKRLAESGSKGLHAGR